MRETRLGTISMFDKDYELKLNSYELEKLEQETQLPIKNKVKKELQKVMREDKKDKTA